VGYGERVRSLRTTYPSVLSVFVVKIECCNVTKARSKLEVETI
jgi:hypothetical protein